MKGITSRHVKLFTPKLIDELGTFKDFGFAGASHSSVWDEDKMTKAQADKILSIIRSKLAGKVIVFRNDIIDLDRRVTSYAVMRKVTWSREYKTLFRMEYNFVCVDSGDNAYVRLFTKDSDNSTYISPNTEYEVIERGQLEKMIKNTVTKITNVLFK